MTTGGVEPVFLDTNILVYASVPRAPLHARALSAIDAQVSTGASTWISRQVVREFIAVLSRPHSFGTPIPMVALTSQVRAFEQRFRAADETSETTRRLLVLLTQVSIGGRQIHDANIVATMQAYGIRHLLTHNTDDFERFAGSIRLLPI
jgi:predicted nucleic acid-binding protein